MLHLQWDWLHNSCSLLWFRYFIGFADNKGKKQPYYSYPVRWMLDLLYKIQTNPVLGENETHNCWCVWSRTSLTQFYFCDPCSVCHAAKHSVIHIRDGEKQRCTINKRHLQTQMCNMVFSQCSPVTPEVLRVQNKTILLWITVYFMILSHWY